MTFPVIIWCILASSCVLGPLTAALMSVPLSLDTFVSQGSIPLWCCLF